jgi:opacity protein-like surface antigen
MRFLLAGLMCGAMPALAAAQTTPATLPANDTIIAIGWAGSDHEIHDQARWQGSLLVAVTVGHYWTDHLKTEVDASWNGQQTGDVYETIERQGGYTYALWDYRARDIRIGISQLYQFGRNAWIHPYVGAGADIVRRQVSLDRAPQSRTVFIQNRSVPVTLAAASERTTTVFAHAVIKSGLKMYVTEKAFFNTELKLGLRRNVDHVVWKLGLGIDF